jgi:hypothetical protein
VREPLHPPTRPCLALTAPKMQLVTRRCCYRLGLLSLMTGKLDWALLKGLRPVAWRMGNLDWAASDHRSLVVEVE